MYGILHKNLKEREDPVRIAIIGSGWFGGGVIRQIHLTKGMHPSVIINRNPLRVIELLKTLNISESQITVIQQVSDIPKSVKPEHYLIANSISFLPDLSQFYDVTFEATGDLLVGAEAAIHSFESDKHFVTVNAEMDSTIGLALKLRADAKKLVYSICDGDQPGCLARIIDQITLWGFDPRVVGNCKGFYDQFQNPEGITPFVPKGQDPLKICSYADGTKQSMELTSVGNAYGYTLFKRGMFGPSTTKPQLIETFQQYIDLNQFSQPCIDYAMGINGIDQGGGVFVIAFRDSHPEKEDLQYMKKGEGPFYLFFRDYHLCYFETVSSLAEAAVFNVATLAPSGRYIDTVAYAKKDLKKGQQLDDLGGFDHYGLTETARITEEENLLPQGLAPYAIPIVDIPKETAITRDMVQLPENLVVSLRKEQEQVEID